ncbi:MAG: response regulator transcription factor, partial [Vicinamibacterales bacterium]
ILIVDDNPAIREILTEALAAAGHVVVEASDGQEALDLAQISRPSLILLDLNIPVVSGFSFVAAAQERDINAPILLVTADPRAAQVAVGEQIVGYLAKPFDLDAVIDRVATALNRRHQLAT